MEPVRSALYLDFDNVFSGLMKLDPAVALSFADAPGQWLSRLAQSGPRRRWLVLRCYLNPAGSMADPRTEGARLLFFKFRSAFIDAGFEVIDCPRLSHTKNGADIRLVIDAVEALQADVRYDEFVIASGDSDMTPLLMRLRAADREITLVSPSDSAVVMQAVADRLIGGDDLLELIDTRLEELEPSLGAEDDSIAPGLDGASLGEAEARHRFEEIVRLRYAEATEPINLSGLAQEVGQELGAVAKSSRWFGHGGFVRALQSLDLPGVRMAHPFMWDGTRHVAPDVTPSASPELSADVISRVSKVLRLPMLPPESWSGIYDSLATFVRTYDFNLTEMTRWSRDRLVQQEVKVNRQAVSLVAHGAAFAGCPLYRQPPPTADEIAAAFLANVVGRAQAADIDLPSGETEALRRWFGVGSAPT